MGGESCHALGQLGACGTRAGDGRTWSRCLSGDARSGCRLAQGGRTIEGEVGVAGEGRRYRVRRTAGGTEEAWRARRMSGGVSSTRSRMDRFIDGIELLAACFVGIVA